MKKIQYGVWEVDSSDSDASYWMLYDSLEDAVSEKGDGTQVYKAEFKPLGVYKREVSLVKVPKSKGAKKKPKKATR